MFMQPKQISRERLQASVLTDVRGKDPSQLSPDNATKQTYSSKLHEHHQEHNASGSSLPTKDRCEESTQGPSDSPTAHTLQAEESSKVAFMQGSVLRKVVARLGDFCPRRPAQTQKHKTKQTQQKFGSDSELKVPRFFTRAFDGKDLSENGLQKEIVCDDELSISSFCSSSFGNTVFPEESFLTDVWDKESNPHRGKNDQSHARPHFHEHQQAEASLDEHPGHRRSSSFLPKQKRQDIQRFRGALPTAEALQTDKFAKNCPRLCGGSRKTKSKQDFKHS